MKSLKSLLIAFTFLGILSMFSFTRTNTMDNRAEVTSKIEKFLSNSNYTVKAGEAVVYSNFLISEEGFIYNVDFLTDGDEIVVLSKDLEKEYYRVEAYNSKIMQMHSVPVTQILSDKVTRV